MQYPLYPEEVRALHQARQLHAWAIGNVARLCPHCNRPVSYNAAGYPFCSHCQSATRKHNERKHAA